MTQELHLHDLRNLTCPVCQSDLQQDTTTANIISCFGETTHTFPQYQNQPVNLTYPEELAGNDALYFEQYKEIAQHYDNAMIELFAMHDSDHTQMRQGLVDSANLKPGDRVIDISTGTGPNVSYILDAIGSEGELVLFDLSPNMLAVAQEKFGIHNNVKFVLGNASYLPFEDSSFDAVIHSGGINTFTERQRAVEEFQRIAKVGGKIIVSDEGMGSWNLDTDYGKQLAKVNGLYLDQPPLEFLPVEIEDVQLNWIMGNVFYVLQWRKRAAEPVLRVPEGHPHA